MKGRHEKQGVTPFEKSFYDDCDNIRSRFYVSSKSKWSDDIWRMSHSTPGHTASKAAISWQSMRVDGELLEDAKLFVWSLLTENLRGKAIKTISLQSISASLKTFLKWMMECGIERFSELPERFGYIYKDHLIESRGVENLAVKTIVRYLDIPIRIYEQSPVLAAAGRDGIRFHPYGGQNANKVASSIGNKEQGHIPPVPDKLFVAVTSEVFRWVEQYSPDIIRCVCIADEARRAVPRYEKDSAYNVNKALRRYVMSSDELEGDFAFGNRSTCEFRKLLSDLRVACVIAIQAFVGIRISELLSLEAVPRQLDTGWPVCISVRPSRDGLFDIFYINGRVAKARDDYDSVEWVAGARPAGTSYLPPAVKAILVLEEAFRPWRNDAVTRLVISQHGGRGLPDHACLKPQSYCGAAFEQVSFVQRYIYDKNPQLANELSSWVVSTHQWRKSFAQFVVRSDESLLRAISEHFKHVSLAMTSEDYIGNDIELLRYLEDEVLQRAAEVMIDLASHSTYGAGPLADLIEARAKTIRGLAGEGTRKEKVQAIKDILEGDSVRSWACGWGDCLFRPETARCHLEMARSVDLSKTRPNIVARRPSLCCDCQNLIVLKEHEPFWRKRKQENLSILNGEKDKNSAIARTAKSRVDQCSRILTKLNRSKKKVNVK